MVRFRSPLALSVDEIIIFNPLAQEDIKRIVDLELEPLYKKISERGIHLEVTAKAKEYLTRKGLDIDFGARPLKRAIQKYIQDPLSLKLLSGAIKEGDKVFVDSDGNGSLVFR